MEADCIMDALEDGTAQVVIEQGSGYGIEVGKGLDVTIQEVAIVALK